MNHSNWNSCIDFERNELVFENRNKRFGAYVIRRDYPRTMLLAFLTSCLFMGSLFIPFLMKSPQGMPNALSEKFSEVISLETFIPPPIELTPPSITPPSPPVQNAKELTNPVVVNDKIATPDVLMTTGTIPAPVLPANGGTITSTSISGMATLVIPEKIPENTVKKWAEIMPKFQGGEEKLFSYLSSHIRYPSKALQNNIAGTVYVSFVVDTSGLITNVQLIRGLSQDCDLEAMKAVKNMPKWIPGSQNGKKVSVEMSLPVRFIIK
jgi:periplasmic protein TonB